MGKRVNRGFHPSRLSPRIQRIDGLGGPEPAASEQKSLTPRAPRSGGEKPHTPGRPVKFFAVFCEGRVLAIKEGAGPARAFVKHLKLHRGSEASTKAFLSELAAQEFSSWWNYRVDATPQAPRTPPPVSAPIPSYPHHGTNRLPEPPPPLGVLSSGRALHLFKSSSRGLLVADLALLGLETFDSLATFGAFFTV